MANAETKIEVIEFSIEENQTVCNLFYSSSEPGNMAWGGGWKSKVFNKELPITDFINQEVPNYLDWDSGRKAFPKN